jgi:hypothetical protein
VNGVHAPVLAITGPCLAMNAPDTRAIRRSNALPRRIHTFDRRSIALNRRVTAIVEPDHALAVPFVGRFARFNATKDQSVRGADPHDGRDPLIRRMDRVTFRSDHSENGASTRTLARFARTAGIHP